MASLQLVCAALDARHSVKGKTIRIALAFAILRPDRAPEIASKRNRRAKARANTRKLSPCGELSNRQIRQSLKGPRQSFLLIGWDRSGRWLRHRRGLRFRRGYRSPKLWSCAITSPQLSTLDLADEFALHRFFRLDLQQRLVAGLGRSTLGVCTCRKTNCGKNNKGLHCHFPFAFGAGTITLPSLKTACDGCRDW